MERARDEQDDKSPEKRGGQNGEKVCRAEREGGRERKRGGIVVE